MSRKEIVFVFSVEKSEGPNCVCAKALGHKLIWSTQTGA